MARSSLKLVIDQKRPALNLSDPDPKAGRQLLRKVIRHLEGILGGAVNASHIMFEVDGAQPLAAQGTVTAAAVAAADTITLGATTLTGTEKRANCTVTLASVANNDTVTVNGRVFTAKTGSPSGDYEFLVGVSDAADASALVAKINGVSSAATEVYGIIESVRPAANGVVNIYAIATGTAGNSYTIATSNGTRLAITNDSGGSFAGGAANVNNVFDPMGNDIRTATEIARCITDSTTALVSKHCEASNWAGSIALSSAAAGDRWHIAGHEFRAVATLADEIADGDFNISGTDTQDGDRLAARINEHPVLAHQVWAQNSSGTVTIRQRRGTSALGKITGPGTITQFAAVSRVLISSKAEGQSGNAIALASSNGTRLAVSGAALSGGTGGESGTIVRMVLGASAN